MQVLQLHQLQDIARNIQINSSDLLVTHLHYRLRKTSVDIMAQLQKLPQEMRNEYLSLSLRNLILGIYYNGSLLLEKNQVFNQEDKT